MERASRCTFHVARAKMRRRAIPSFLPSAGSLSSAGNLDRANQRSITPNDRFVPDRPTGILKLTGQAAVS